ncbi:hypothetical protein [Psychrobacter sp. S1-30-MNA-CIBAN-0213]|uniref:hypothetical protein n=1 Tax=unclassified Psychrobacter TaxID=196806 RepID=UPI00331E39CF
MFRVKKLNIVMISSAILLNGCTNLLTDATSGDELVSSTETMALLIGSNRTVSDDKKLKIKSDATNNTDWTPIFNPMKAGCEIPAYFYDKDFPPQYKTAITFIESKGDPTLEEDSFTTTYVFKNSVAFGYPIKSFEYLQGYEWHRIKLFFEDKSFMQLMPLFTPPNRDDYPSDVKHNSTGYEHVGAIFTYLHFDVNEKSIVCESGI